MTVKDPEKHGRGVRMRSAARWSNNRFVVGVLDGIVRLERVHVEGLDGAATVDRYVVAGELIGAQNLGHFLGC